MRMLLIDHEGGVSRQPSSSDRANNDLKVRNATSGDLLAWAERLGFDRRATAGSCSTEPEELNHFGI